MFKVGPFHSLRNVSAIVYSPCGTNIYQSPKAICFEYKITGYVMDLEKFNWSTLKN